MSFSQENGYTPVSIETIMGTLMAGINAQFGTTYTADSFVGTNFYKYFYALAQRVQENEIKTDEIFLKLQQYIDYINARISRPVNTNPGIVDRFMAEGFIASTKPMIEADAGKIHICVDTDETADNYASLKLAICTLISQITVAGAVTIGPENETIVLSNGQAFDFNFSLPNRIPTKIKLTVILSENNQVAVGSPDDVKIKLLSNMLSRYRLGKNFEPQKYFAVADAPWSSMVTLEYSFNDGETWQNTIYEADFDDLLTFSLADITLIEG